MSILTWANNNYKILGQSAGALTLTVTSWIDYLDMAIRLAGGLAGLTLTLILIYKALLDIKKKSKT